MLLTLYHYYVGCPHEHDGYDPYDIREFHVLMVDLSIGVKGTLGGMNRVYFGGCYPV